MSVTIQIDGREAIPIRALPFVTGWMVTPSALVRELAGENGTPGLTAYWADGGLPIKPQSWGVVLDSVSDLTCALKKTETAPDENRQIGRRQTVKLLPAGAFVWRDEFSSWYGANYFANDTIWEEQHQVLGEDDDPTPLFIPRRDGDSLDLSPIIQSDETVAILEGFAKEIDAGNFPPALPEPLSLSTVPGIEAHCSQLARPTAQLVPAANAESTAMPVLQSQKPAEGITKAQVLMAFDELVTINLRKALQDGKGLFGEKGARTQKGTPGGKHTALWDPVLLAIGLHDKYFVPMLHLKRAFHDNSFLREWLPKWSAALDLIDE